MTKTMRKHLNVFTALVMMLCMLCTMFASCSFLSGLTPITISLNKTEAALYVGDSLKLEANVSDKDAEVEWSTSDETVVTVRRGTVRAVGVGSAVITATVEDGASATCNITVSERTVTISQPTATINLDESNTLTLTATSSDNGTISWSSSDPSVADVANGVVTAYDIGNVTITAQRGTAKATCEITVVEPSRPADYYKITKLTNAEVVANPGTWYYHADGSGSDYGFESEPLHRNSTASATLNPIPKVANSQYFYFRYQPDQVELNTYYTMSVTITVSEDATLRIGSRRADGSTFAPLQETFKANEAKTVEYIGYKNEYEPFSVRINSEIEAEKVTLTVKLNSVEAHDGKNLPEYHTHVEAKPQIKYEALPTDTSSYDLEIKTNGETMSAPDKWHYNQGESSLVNTAKYENGTITFGFDTLQMTGNNQLRYRPTLDDNTKIKVTFTVSSNVAAKVVVALCHSTTFATEGWSEKRLDGTNSQTISAEFTLKSAQLIFIQVQALDEVKENATLTFSDIKIYKGEESEAPAPEQPIVNGYALTAGNKATVLADPGTWYYWCDGADGVDYAFASTPKYEDEVLTFAFNSMAAEGTPGYQLRYQPELAVGTNYSVTFTVEVTAAGKVIYGSDYKVHEFTEAGSTTITWEGTVSDSEVFLIQIRSTDRSAPITMTVSDIVIEEKSAVEPEQPIVNGYEITSGNKATVLANPGTWYYFGDGAEGTDFELASTPKYEDGTITYAFSKMTEGANYMLRYQPEFEAGTNYTISVTVEVTAACKILYSKDYKVHVFSEAGSITLEWTGAVDAENPYMIQIKECTAPITMTVSDIVIEEKIAEEPEQPEQPVVNGYELTSSNNSGVVATPGKWFYSCDGADGTEYEFAFAPKYEDGVLTFAFNKMAEGSPTYQLRYQPQLAVDTEYTVTFTVEVTAAGKVVYGNDYKAYEFAEAGKATITWEGKVSASAPFMIQIRSTDRSAPITMTVSDIVIESKQAVEPEQPVVSYEITAGNKQTVRENAGTWYYWCDGAEGTDYEFTSAPQYEDGVITFAFDNMAEGTPAYQLRYQPELEVGASYKITFTVEVSAAGKVIYGTDYKAQEFAEAGTQTITWEGTVTDGEVFLIQIRSTDRSTPITMTVSNIVITAA